MFSRKPESTSREAAECENNLGKAPPVPPEANVMHISERIVDRISTGAADEERRNAYDDYWLEKIACMDKAHSVNSKLDLEEIAKIEKRLRQYVTGGKKCPLDRTLVTRCYVNNKNETLKCGRDVEEFLKCVDSHFYRAVRGANEESSKSSSSNKRASYAEKFKRGY